MGITKVRLTKEEIIAAVRSENYGDSDLSSFASLSGSGLIERKSEGVIEAVPVTDYIKTLLNDASSAEVRTTLGLGSIATASTSSYLPITGGTLTGALIATSFSGVGTALTALNASNISTGTLNAARLPASYLPLTGGTITGDLISTSATVSTSPTTGAICGASLGISGAIFAGTLNGNGSGLTTLNASNLSSGTIPDARLTGAYTGITNLTGSGTATFGAFSGSGASLTALNASNISTGTINAARLPAAYLPLTGGTVTGTLTVAAEVSSGTIHLGGTATTGYYSQVVQSGNNLDIIANGDQAFRVSVGTNNGTGNIRFFTAGYALGNTERMQITATGNVGIGSVNPSTKLQVAGTTTTTDMIVSATTPSTSPTTGASRVTGGQGVQGNQHIGGFTSLGGTSSGHPAIKLIQFSGVTGASQGAITNIAHNLTLSKIVGIQVFLRIDSSYFIPPGFTEVEGYLYTWSIYILNFNLRLSGSNSASILSKEFEVLIFYKG